MEGVEASVQLLGQGQAHQGVADVDDHLSQGHLHQRAPRRNDAHAGHLSGGGQVGGGNAHRRGDGQPQADAQNAEAEGHRQIPQGDGDAVLQSGEELFFHGTFAPFAEIRNPL